MKNNLISSPSYKVDNEGRLRAKIHYNDILV